MASPIDLIRRGIKTADWKLVCKGFAGLTGDKLKPPSTSNVPDPNELEARIDAFLRTYLPKFFAEAEDEEDIHVEEEFPVEVESTEAETETSEETNSEVDKFKIEPRQVVNEQGKRACKAIPIPTGPRPNNWHDDGRLATKDIRDSKKLSKKKKPEPRRPKVVNIQVVCAKCQKKELVPPIMAPKAIGDAESQYVCNRCITKGSRKYD